MNVRSSRTIALGLSAILLTMTLRPRGRREDARLVEEDGDRGEVPVRGRGDRRRQQGRQARRADRRFVVRGPLVGQARHPQAGRLRRRPARLQRVHDLLDRRHQRRRLGRPDRHRLPRRARVLVREPQGQAGPLASPRDLAQRLQRDAALCRPLRRRPSRAGHGLAAQGQGQRRPDGLVHARRRPDEALGDAPDQRAQQSRPRHPRHVPVRARPGRGRPERRRPPRRDLHRRVVGTARGGPQGPPRRGRSTPPSWATPWPT